MMFGLDKIHASPLTGGWCLPKEFFSAQPCPSCQSRQIYFIPSDLFRSYVTDPVPEGGVLTARQGVSKQKT